MIVIATYVIYLCISVAVTVWVARSLSQHGRTFLVHQLRGNEPLADSLNHLLVVGFYLVNIGWVCVALRYGTQPVDIAGLIEYLSTKLGLVLLVLGIMHLFNLYWISGFDWDRYTQAPVLETDKELS
ncbi:hypothetical protein VVD49_18660 [Uliginosibacterium sp. H3]|uniref:Integral membrane protein n=1 Tax=Uliginosibacterium silvisoli TaxID=3114758 RepID=A0ABU6K8J9_9RHOO|nr:hypothetical protein [Uliginosibacterium sp. H3]